MTRYYGYHGDPVSEEDRALYSDRTYQVESFDIAPAGSTGVIPSVEDSLVATVLAYEHLQDTVQRLYEIKLQVADLEIELRQAKAGILSTTDPKTLGSNEATREANLSIATSAQSEALRKATKHMLALATAEEVARIRVRLADQTLAHVRIAHHDRTLQEFGRTEVHDIG